MLFSSKKLKLTSEHEFETCVFDFVLKRRITGKEVVGKVLDTIAVLKNSEHSELHDTWAIDLYRSLERHISESQAEYRVGKEQLRADIEKHCNPERAHGSFALFFLSAFPRKTRIFVEYVNHVLSEAKAVVEKVCLDRFFGEISKEPDFSGIMLEDRLVHSDEFTQLFEGLSAAEQEKKILEFFSGILSRFRLMLEEAMKSVRTRLFFEKTYQSFRQKFSFLDDAPQVLLIIPSDLLQEERTALLPKIELEKEARDRARKLETALQKIQDEKNKLADALGELRAASRGKEDFVNVVSHQFRTPLSVIRWTSELLEDAVRTLIPQESADAPLEYVLSIRAKSQFLVYILDDIFDVLAIEDGSWNMNKKPSQLWEIVSEAVRTFAKEAQQREVTIVFDRSLAPIEEMALDKEAIRRVIEVLLRNAVQYSPPKSSVAVLLEKVEWNGKTALRCTIRDSGIGIEKENLESIFTKFFRAKNAIAAVPDGAGLGLYLAKRYVEAHGGIITVESELGKGSEFTLVIPKE